MDRRDFLKGLMGIPLGWKALFRQDDKPGQPSCYDGDGEIEVWVGGEPGTDMAWFGISDMAPDLRPADFVDGGIGLYPQDWQLDHAPMRVEFYGTGDVLYTPNTYAVVPVWYKLIEREDLNWPGYLFIYWELTNDGKWPQEAYA